MGFSKIHVTVLMRKRHVNQLRHSRKINHEMTETVKEAGQSDKQYSNYDRYEMVNTNIFSGYNENIKEQLSNENAIEHNHSQISYDIVTGTVVNNKYDDTTDKSVKNKSIKNNEVNSKKSAPCKD